MTRRARARHTASAVGAASVTRSASGAIRALRRREHSLAKGDRIALGIGLALVALMLAWFGWRLGQTVATDRAVAPGVAPAPAMPGH